LLKLKRSEYALFSHLQSEREKSAKEMVAVTDNSASPAPSSPGNQTPTGSKRKSTGSINFFDL